MNFTAITMRKGFTVIELLIVVSIIAILAAAVGINAIASGQKSRDAKRQADIRTLQTAIELYKQKNGRYPAGCRGHDVWSGQQGSSYACAAGDTQYIVGLAPEFIPVLPFDKKLNGTNSGYAYITNSAGTVYKVIAMNTVESEVVNYNHPLKSCDIRPDGGGNLQNMGASGVDTSGWCTIATIEAREPAGSPVTSVGQISHCRSVSPDNGNGRFERSYAAWGGLEVIAGGVNRAVQLRNTTRIICK